MPIEVEAPGGVIVEFPDGTDATIIKSAMAKKFGGPSVAETASDVARQTAIGFNRGLDNLLNLPGDVLMRAPARALGLEQYVPQRGSYATRFNPGGSLYFGNRSDQPQTTPGRYAEQVGQAAGASVLPGAGVVAAAPRLATVAATTVPRAVARQIGTTVSRAPAAAAGADLVAATGAGLAQQGAEDAGAGPLGQTLAGLAGGFAPFAPLAAAHGARRAVDAARARSDRYARVADSLVDDIDTVNAPAAGVSPQRHAVNRLADAASVGTTRNEVPTNRPVFDMLGEEMVRANGDRVAAVAATRARLVAGGATPDAAREQISRVLNAHRNNNLMIGEYPAVTTADMATRQRNPYAPRSQVGRDAATIYEEEFTRAGGDAVAARAAAENRMRANGVPQAQITDRINRIQAGRVTDAEISAGATRVPNTQQQMDYIANAGITPSAHNMRAAITERAASLGARMLERVRGLSPGGRSIRDVEDMVNQVQQRLSAEYSAVHNTPALVNRGVLYRGLDIAIRNSVRRLRGRGGEAASALRQAIDGFYRTNPAREAAASQPNVVAARIAVANLQNDIAQARIAFNELRRQRAAKPVVDAAAREMEQMVEALRIARVDARQIVDRSLPTSLQVVQDARGELRGLIQEARQAGRTHVVQVLQRLYDDVTAVMTHASPRWAEVNRRWADMRIDEVAAELGEAFATKAGPRLREQLREFAQLAPEARNVVRVYYVQKLLDEVEHEIRLQGQTNLGKLFDRQDKRNIIRAILGDEAANILAREARDANVMAKSLAGIRGSQTHIRGQVQHDNEVDLRAIAAAAQLNWSNWREAALDRTIGALREFRNRGMGRILQTPMRDVESVAEHVARMRSATNRLDVANNALRNFPADTRLLLGARPGAQAPAINPQSDQRR
jgi:hypothetical protein